jgi:hypothetical protein
MGPAETLNSAGMAFVLDELGAPLQDKHGDRLAPVALVPETYVRNPRGKHECLELFARHGIELPDTPPMAVHRGRIDLLEDHLRRDPQLLTRTYAHREIWPPELGCHDDETLALHGTPLAGGTLLHLASYGTSANGSSSDMLCGVNSSAPSSVITMSSSRRTPNSPRM